MDALIFSCGTGGGHNSAANAVKQELLRRGHRVTMLDPYSLSNTRVGSLINQSYINLVKKAPRLFGLVYQLGNLYRRLPVHSPVYHINHRMALPVQRFLEEGNFDLIIMPHIFPGEILTNMRDHGICLPPTLLIATDYTCIPFTENVKGLLRQSVKAGAHCKVVPYLIVKNILFVVYCDIFSHCYFYFLFLFRQFVDMI